MSQLSSNGVTPEQPFAVPGDLISGDLDIPVSHEEPIAYAPASAITGASHGSPVRGDIPVRANVGSPESSINSRSYPRSAMVGANEHSPSLGGDRTVDHVRGVASLSRATPVNDGGKPHHVFGGESEVMLTRTEGRKTYARFAPTGRLGRGVTTFSADLSVGKFGVLGDAETCQLEERLFRAFVNDGFSVHGKSLQVREEFLRVLHLFLAINSGSIGNVSGRIGVSDDSQPLQFGDVEVSAIEVSTVIGDRAYAYMRARATEIRDTLESAFKTAALPDAENLFPGVCRAVDLVRVVAAAKGLSQYPQYSAVGSQYAANTPPFLVVAIQESAARVLTTTSGNVRTGEV